ncbi:MAG: NADH-quinone oxidoreductase subunit J [Candidatus Aminicenantes bacterium]|nr:NADH-quinone oxidoreductase subunit J [Candidatus Aminicenantes bacterium]
MAQFLFFLLALICVISILGFILSKNQIYNALCLVVAFTAMGGLFSLLDAPFVAVVQIIIYAGAIVVLFLFVIMMIDVRKGIPPEKNRWTLYLSVGISLVLAAEFAFSLSKAICFLKTPATKEIGNPTALGHILFTKYIYPFEITSVLIVTAIVGAIVLAKKREEE